MALEIWIAEMNKELKVKGFVAFAKTLALAPYSHVSLERWCWGGDYIGLSFGLVLNWNSTHLFIFSTLRQPAHCAAGNQEQASLWQLPHRSNGGFPCRPQPQSWLGWRRRSRSAPGCRHSAPWRALQRRAAQWQRWGNQRAPSHGQGKRQPHLLFCTSPEFCRNGPLQPYSSIVLWSLMLPDNRRKVGHSPW